jgi:hypothetical protein
MRGDDSANNRPKYTPNAQTNRSRLSIARANKILVIADCSNQNRRSQTSPHPRSNKSIAQPMLMVHQLHPADILLRNCLLTRRLFVRNPRIRDTHKCTRMFLRGGINDFNPRSRLQCAKACPGCLIGFSQRSARDGKDTNQEQDLSHTSCIPSLLRAPAYHQISPLRQETSSASAKIAGIAQQFPCIKRLSYAITTPCEVRET